MTASTENSGRSAEDILSTPTPGETLAMFYARSRESRFLSQDRPRTGCPVYLSYGD